MFVEKKHHHALEDEQPKAMLVFPYVSQSALAEFLPLNHVEHSGNSWFTQETKFLRIGVVDQVPCQETYIGQTGCTLQHTYHTMLQQLFRTYQW